MMPQIFRPYDSAPLNVGSFGYGPQPAADADVTPAAGTNPPLVPAAGVPPFGVLTPVGNDAFWESVKNASANLRMTIGDEVTYLTTDPPIPASFGDGFAATEGHAAAEALAAVGTAHLLSDALNHLVTAQCAVARASASLALVPVDDPARHRTDLLAVEVHRAVNELGGFVERLLNVGVTP